MEMTLFETAVYVHPKQPVEFLVAYDGKAARVAIEWSLVERLMGTSPVDEAQVREFLRQKREAITLALKAHMYAEGVPLNRHLVMAPDDFEAIGLLAHSALERDATAGPAARAVKAPHL
jgi:hypothetical protein